MDIQALSNMNEQLTNYLNSQKQTQTAIGASTSSNSSSSSSGIVIAKKGDTGYIEAMDSDKDGEISLEEFNEYCEENNISENEKIKLMSLMANAKTTSKVTTQTAEASKEITEDSEDVAEDTNDTSTEDENKPVYAKKGDDKYNEAMDSNNNGVVTYQEYMEYCNNKAKESDKENSQGNKAVQTYEKNENYDDEPEITVEAEA
jgi:hypothetical protein